MPLYIHVPLVPERRGPYVEVQSEPKAWELSLPPVCKDGGVADKLFGHVDPIVLCAVAEPDAGRVVWVHTIPPIDDEYWLCWQGFKLPWSNEPGVYTQTGRFPVPVFFFQMTKAELKKHLENHIYPLGFNGLASTAMYHA